MEKVGVGPAAMRKGVVPLDKVGAIHHLYVFVGEKSWLYLHSLSKLFLFHIRALT